MEEESLEITATIVSKEDDTWYIRAENLDNKENVICNSIRDFSDFMNACAFGNTKEGFKVTWLPSNAKQEHINQVEKELLDLQKEFDDFQG